MSVRVIRPSQRIHHIGWPGAVRVRHGGLGGWSPALPTTDGGVSPEHWYRSDGPLWQDAGVTPASSDGDVVGRWEDKTANADHVNQINASQKPTLQSGAGDLLNGNPVIRFDGSNDVLRGPFTAGGIMSQPNTIFAVAKLDASRIVDGIHAAITDDDNSAAAQLVYKYTNNWRIYAGTSVTGSAADAEWNIWTAVFNGASSQFWHNGVSEASGNCGAGSLTGLSVASFGAPGWGASYPGQYDITELIFYDSNLSTADKNQVGNYLASRYGLSYTNIV